jgi:hypothetical protein
MLATVKNWVSNSWFELPTHIITDYEYKAECKVFENADVTSRDAVWHSKGCRWRDLPITAKLDSQQQPTEMWNEHASVVKFEETLCPNSFLNCSAWSEQITEILSPSAWPWKEPLDEWISAG